MAHDRGSAVRAGRLFIPRWWTRLGLSCLLEGLVVATGLPGPVGPAVAARSAPSAVPESENRPSGDSDTPEESPRVETIQFGMAHVRSARPGRPSQRRLPESVGPRAVPFPSRPVHTSPLPTDRGLNDAGHFLAVGRPLRYWVQSQTC